MTTNVSHLTDLISTLMISLRRKSSPNIFTSWTLMMTCTMSTSSGRVLASLLILTFSVVSAPWHITLHALRVNHPTTKTLTSGGEVLMFVLANPGGQPLTFLPQKITSLSYPTVIIRRRKTATIKGNKGRS